jgi:hypothetical protein
MTEFTPECIAGARKVVGNDAASTSGRIAFIALDHIERLQKRVDELEIYNKDFHLACINALDLHRESDVPKLKDIPKIIEELRTRVQELEVAISNQSALVYKFENMARDLQSENDFLKNNPEAEKYYYQKWVEGKQRIVELEEALAKIASYESMRFKLSPYEYGLLEQIVGIAEHALRDGE